MAAGKDERARIRVEHIIREDYMVEAMEILELYCDLLLSRIGLIQSMKYVTLSAGASKHRVLVVITLLLVLNRELDPGLQEAVSTLIWAAPRLQSDVCELKVVSSV